MNLAVAQCQARADEMQISAERSDPVTSRGMICTEAETCGSVGGNVDEKSKE